MPSLVFTHTIATRTGTQVMARKVRNSSLESRSARLKLEIRRKPYSGPTLARGISLMYRRNKSNGAWVLKASNGHGAYWTKAIGLADDYEDSDGKNVLTFFEAQDVAKKLARGEDGTADIAAITVDSALKVYRRDLESRNSNPYNADWPRLHLPSVLLSKPVALLTSVELTKWRDGLLGTMAASTINRLCACLSAALELATKHDAKRILNRDAWDIGLASLPNAQEVRNVILSDDQVREFVSHAYGLDYQFGLLADTLAITGTRPSQAARLLVGDLNNHPLRPKLMMPKSAKGGGRNRSQKKHERYSVPITVQLAAKLMAAAQGRADNASLLLQSDGSAWGDNPGQSYHREVDRIVNDIRCNPDATMYALRHSSITRMLLLNIPVRIVASLHNTSVRMIEKHYSESIVEHSDDISRRALLQHPSDDTVIALVS
jgi:integrase